MYLEELLRGDGRGECWKDEEGRAACRGCDTGEGVIRCLDCFGGHLVCHKCTVGIHAALPLHRLEVRDIFPSSIFFTLMSYPALEWDFLRASDPQIIGASDSAWSRSWRSLREP